MRRRHLARRGTSQDGRPRPTFDGDRVQRHQRGKILQPHRLRLAARGIQPRRRRGRPVHGRPRASLGRAPVEQALRHSLGEPSRLLGKIPQGERLRRSLRDRPERLHLRRRHRLARHGAEADRRGFRRTPGEPHLRTDADGPGTQPDRPPAPAAEGAPRRPELEGAEHHRIDGGEPFRAAVADRDRRRRRPVAAPDRAIVPAGDGPFAGPLLPGGAPRPRPPPPDPVLAAGGRGCRRLRLRVRLALLQMLPRTLRPLAQQERNDRKQMLAA